MSTGIASQEKAPRVFLEVLERIYGLGALDPVVIVSVLMILGTIALAACSLPARRATKVDPMTVLSQQ